MKLSTANSLKHRKKISKINLFRSKTCVKPEKINTPCDLSIVNELDETPVLTGDSSATESSTYSALTYADEDDTNNSLIPIVVVEGFLCPNKKWYWGKLEKVIQQSKFEKRRILYVNIGSISSMHDRATEIFYQIKGGTVDYGEYHSKVNNHERFGKTYRGLYPKWSDEYPLHLVGHSFGGNTVWMLQNMLQNAMFLNHQTSEKWVYSLTAVSSPLRGTPLTKKLGASPSKIKNSSTLRLLYYALFLYENLNIPSFKTNYYDFNLNLWREKSNTSSITTKKKQTRLLWKALSKPRVSIRADNAAVDMIPQRMQAFNLYAETSKHIFYRSYACQMTRTGKRFKGLPEQARHLVSPFMLFSMIVSSYNPTPNDKTGPLVLHTKGDKELWRPNDGICPMISQFHPEKCSEKHCKHYKKFDLENKDNEIKRERGFWNVVEINGCSHRDVFPFAEVGGFDSALKEDGWHIKIMKDLVNYLNDLDDIFVKEKSYNNK